jgi:hypothetical protein
MALEPSKYFTPITAWFAGITAFIAALAAVLNAFGTLDLSPVVNIFRRQSYAIAVIDAEYAVSRDVSYWSDVDITEAPVGRIEAGNFVRVRGLIKDYELYMIELSSVEIAFVSKHNLIEADTYRQETIIVGTQNTGNFLFDIRASASWSSDTAIFEAPSSASKIVGHLTAGEKMGHERFNQGEVQVIDRVQQGGWLQVGVAGKSIGFVQSKDVVELWPTGVVTYSEASEELIESFKRDGGANVEVRRGPNYLRLETSIECEYESCDRISFYSSVEKTPNGPRAYTGQPVLGSWSANEDIKIYAILPLDFLDMGVNDVYYCIGTKDGCLPSAILRVSAAGVATFP